MPRQVTEMHNLLVCNPELARQWDYEKNGDLRPEQVAPNARRKVWWIGDCGCSWEATVDNRNRGGKGCNKHKNDKWNKTFAQHLDPKRSISAINPEIALEWHPTLNEEWTPERVAAQSNREFWWQCKNGHSWQATPSARNQGSKCVDCSMSENNLQAVRPDIAAEWHPTKNGELKPTDIAVGSSEKCWWLCRLGHEWRVGIDQRTRIKGTGCPFCKRRRASPENNFMIAYPQYALMWHPTKNDHLQPNDISPKSNKKYWFQCLDNPTHEWQIVAGHVATIKSLCPFCSHQEPSAEYNLATENPDLASEWDFERNQGVMPYDILPNSNKKFWWKCKICSHSWHTSVNNRQGLNGRGCPKCADRLFTSFPEQAIYFYIKQIYSDARNRHLYRIANKKQKHELDIYIPSLRIGIEYDGQWHKKKEQMERDNRKSELLYNSGILLIRIRQHDLPALSNKHDLIIQRDDNSDNALTKCIKEAINVILTKYPTEHTIDIDVERDKTLIYQQMCNVRIAHSFAIRFPQLLEEWDFDKNQIDPFNIAPFSKVDVWWKCKKNQHEWSACLFSRAQGNGCPHCNEGKHAGRPGKLTENDVRKIRERNKSIPEMAKQYNITEAYVRQILRYQARKSVV